MPDTIKQKISALASDASLEILPDTDFDFLKQLSPRTYIYITDLSNPDLDFNRKTTFACAKKLLEEGMIPVPHIAARRIENERTLKEVLERLNDQGIQNVMLIAGDLKSTKKFTYSSSIELLKTGLFDGFNISIAAHPDANWLTTPGSAQAHEALNAKIDLINLNQSLRVVTQLSFDPDKIIEWTKTLNFKQHSAPVRIGITGPATYEEKEKYAKKCKLDKKNIVLTQGTRLYKIFKDTVPDEMITQLVQTPQPKSIGGIHFFTFGNPLKTAQFIRSLREGDFTLNEQQTGFSLNSV